MNLPADFAQRQQALDITRSFVVQAPAGSGKTGLLIRRYLRLLAYVNKPEEILAITFTIKAADEMRHRILQALRVGNDAEPADPGEKEVLILAQAAREQDKRMQWGILERPTRLRVQTIDSFCNALVAQMPWSARLGASPELTDNARELYQQAASDMLNEIDNEGTPWPDAISRVLQHFDGDVSGLRANLAAMLPQREQWLRFAGDTGCQPALQRDTLEKTWRKVIHRELEDIHELFPPQLRDEVVTCSCFAAANLVDEGRDSPIVHCEGLDHFPLPDTDELALWRGVADLLLLKDKDVFREKVDKRHGFPADKLEHATAIKRRMRKLLRDVQAIPELAKKLGRVRRLPGALFTDEQWQVLQAGLHVLRLSAAKLRLVFQDAGCIDFAELTHCARLALGSADAPTDLALAMDYRIQHLLVDEFQDTSLTQMQLVESLTAGWQDDDGRTLFLVGDPMQSIYRFRESEVGLFLNAAKYGVGSVSTGSVALHTNFRSQASIVNWVNTVFAEIFPTAMDATAGSVPFLSSNPFIQGGEQGVVQLHSLVNDNDYAAEAACVVDIVRNALDRDAHAKVAVLVRNRLHLQKIIPALQQTRIPLQGVEIEPLQHRLVVQDLLSLTKALLHPADRIAWLALLRAPWCGLSLDDLTRLCADHHDLSVWDRICDNTTVAGLSDAGQIRLLRLKETLQQAFEHRQRRNLRRYVESVWLSLGAPLCIDERDMTNAQVYFDILESHETGADIIDFEQLHRAVAGLWALPDAQEHALQIMTIHKAKGLEFDTVILPGLARHPGNTGPTSGRLLEWLELDPGHGGEILLAPVAPVGNEKDPMHSYIGEVKADKERHEQLRLLYVACTRAKTHLHLIANLKAKSTGELSPPGKDTALSFLWPVIGEEFLRKVTPFKDASIKKELPARDIALHRLPESWRLPNSPEDVQGLSSPSVPFKTVSPIEFDWAGHLARRVGTVVHTLFNEMHSTGLQAPIRTRCYTLLREAGINQQEMEWALERVEMAMENTHNDARAQWIFDQNHRDRKSEWPLSGVIDGRVVRAVIDRSFIDDRGNRWIVDFKTSSHEGGGVERFLDDEVTRYRDQIRQYGYLVSALESRPIKLGLYFPLLKAWREIPFAQGN